jgi:hypothetical protein
VPDVVIAWRLDALDGERGLGRVGAHAGRGGDEQQAETDTAVSCS